MSDIATFDAVDAADAAPEGAPTPPPAAAAPPPPAPAAVEAAPRKAGLIGLLPIVAVTLAAVASVASAAGLIVATRNVAETQHTIAELARAHTHDAAPAPTPAAPQRKPGQQVDVAAASAGMAMMPAEGPVDSRFATITEMRAALVDLRQDLAKHQGPGNVMVMEAMRDGQTDLANRISDLATKVDRLERSISSSRKGQP
jgi:hypothetical protein